jgi:hypothetical protein
MSSILCTLNSQPFSKNMFAASLPGDTSRGARPPPHSERDNHRHNPEYKSPSFAKFMHRVLEQQDTSSLTHRPRKLRKSALPSFCLACLLRTEEGAL